MGNPTEDFAELVAGDDAAIPLDEVVLQIAAHAHPGRDIRVVLGQLDALAARVPDRAIEGLAERLFVVEGFHGNADDHDDPRNSYLDDVVERRTGIPISLSVLMIEVGRRAGIALEGVGMPGHFIVAPVGVDGVWYAPFEHGVRLDRAGAERLFTGVHGPGAPFRAEYLMPTPKRRIVDRWLLNLQRSLGVRDRRSVAWVLRLRLRIPDQSPSERHRIATMLGSVGAFTEAAAALDTVASQVAGDQGEQVTRQALAFRARGN